MLDRRVGSAALGRRQNDGVRAIREFPKCPRGNEVPDNENGHKYEEAEKEHLEEPETREPLVPAHGFAFDFVAQDGSWSRRPSPKNFIGSVHNQDVLRSECTIVGSATRQPLGLAG